MIDLTQPVASGSPRRPEPPVGERVVRSAPLRGHLNQVDLFRVLTFAAVVAVHATAFTNPSVSTAASGVGVLLHFTREAFFFLTGFVLVYSLGDRPLRVASFWRRRFRLIGVPYVVWTVGYAGYNAVVYGAAFSPKVLAVDVLTGQGYFHLYFLLVTMQAYLAFPLLLRLLELTRRHPWWLLAAAAALELGETWWLHHSSPVGGVAGWYAHWAYLLLPTYALYVVAGALAARHLAVVQARVLHHRVAVLLLGLASAVVTEGWYLFQVHRGVPSSDGSADASTVLQPVMVLWSCGAILLLALVSCHWAARPARPGAPDAGRPWLRRAVAWGSSASFGVYLVHPLVLDGVLALGLHGPRPRLVAQPIASVLAWALTVLGSLALVAVLRRTPLSLPLTGRTRPVRGSLASAQRPLIASTPPAPPELINDLCQRHAASGGTTR